MDLPKRQYFSILFLLILFPLKSFTQPGINDRLIKEMKWQLNHEIYLELTNDSSYVLKIEDLHHSNLIENNQATEEFTYFPAPLDEGFMNYLKSKSTLAETSENKTLWSSLHQSLGGGWVHFVNCLRYALETRQLDVKAPLLKRPDTKWKPKPITESYKRTKKWEYYIPVNQKYALKEYKTREKENSLADLKGVPQEFLTLFLSTSEKEYQELRKKRDLKTLAKIDLVKILLGAKYLGEAQVSYIKTMVLKAAMQYSIYNLPSVIILNNFNAAVAMTLDETGYKIQEIVFSEQEKLPEKEISQKRQQINLLVDRINDKNRENFENKLKSLYN
ncbi:MAG: hypothetical protein ACOCXD_00060 [Bacteroidota bacterium]